MSDRSYEKIKVIDSDLEKRVMTGFVSRDATFTLYVNGPWNPPAIGRLIEQLQMTKEWLEEDERYAAVEPPADITAPGEAA